MKIGDTVKTPKGSAQIVDMRPTKTWVFGRAEHDHLITVMYPNGDRKIWIGSHVSQERGRE